MSLKSTPTLWNTTKSDWIGFPDASENEFLDVLNNIIEFPYSQSDREEVTERLEAYDTQVTESALQQIVK